MMAKLMSCAILKDTQKESSADVRVRLIDELSTEKNPEKQTLFDSCEDFCQMSLV